MKDYHCDDKEGLVAYLYGELGPDERGFIEAHLASCQVCAIEVDALTEVRQELGAWLPPDSELGFTVVQKPTAAVLRPPRWRAPALPVWGQAAAAVLILAAGAAIANVQVRYDATGVTVSTGWKAVASSPVAGVSDTAAGPAVSTAAEGWRPALAKLESDMRRELQVLQQSHVPSSAAASGTSDAALLRRVQSLIDASEQRQRQELALRLTQFGRDIEVQRRTDLVRIEQGVGQLQGRTGAEVARQRELLNYLVRVSGRQVIPE